MSKIIDVIGYENLDASIQKILNTHELQDEQVMGAYLTLPNSPIKGFWCKNCGRVFSVVKANIPLLEKYRRFHLNDENYLSGEFINCDYDLKN